jgi:hypothetical protein
MTSDVRDTPASENKKKKEKIDLRISYNGVVTDLKNVKTSETGAKVLTDAIALFPNVERPHEERLYRVDSIEELPSDQTVEQIGLVDDELLILRPRSVQGG